MNGAMENLKRDKCDKNSGDRQDAVQQNDINVVDWQSSVTSSNEYFSILDDEYRLLYVNHPQPGLESYHGKSVFDFIDPEYHQSLRQTIEKTTSTGLPHYFESVAMGPSGEKSHYSNWIIKLESPHQQGSIAVIGSDITHFKRMERVVQHTEEKYQRIFDSVPISIIATDSGGKIIDINPYHMDVIGNNKIDKSDYLGKDITEYPSVIKAGLSKEYKNVLLGKPFNMKDVYFPSTSSGSDGYFNIFGQPQYNGDQIIGAIYMHENITHLKEAIELKQRLIAILESTSDYVGIANQKGETIYINSALRKLAGLDADEEVSGISISQYHPESESIRIMEKGIPYAVKHGIWRSESIFKSADGKEIPTSQILIAHKSTDGEVKYLSTIARDISELKANEQELLKYREHLEELVSFRTSELNSAVCELESFAYSVSHDLRAPLRSINSFSQILAKDYAQELHPTALDYLKRVQKNAIYMSELIDDMLNLSRISRHEFVFEEINLSHLVKDSLTKLEHQTNQRQVQIDIMPDVVCRGDVLLLRIVIDNLVNNAWKFTRNNTNAKLEFGVKRTPGKDIFYLRDNGVGFNMTYANKLFKPFQRLHQTSEFEGHGIGLATAQRIIKRHGGTIWAESVENQGSTFYFSLNQNLPVSSNSVYLL